MSTQIPDNVRKVADTLKAEMSVGDNGVVEISSEAFEKTLEGTDLTMELYEKTQDHRDLVLAGQGLALGELGLETFKENDKIDQVSVELKLHKDVLGTTFAKSKQVPDGNGGMRPGYGILSSRVQANGAANRGSLKKVKSHLSEQAKAVLDA